MHCCYPYHGSLVVDFSPCDREVVSSSPVVNHDRVKHKTLRYIYVSSDCSFSKRSAFSCENPWPLWYDRRKQSSCVMATRLQVNDPSLRKATSTTQIDLNLQDYGAAKPAITKKSKTFAHEFLLTVGVLYCWFAALPTRKSNSYILLLYFGPHLPSDVDKSPIRSQNPPTIQNFVSWRSHVG
jgi:hypothetical protein